MNAILITALVAQCLALSEPENVLVLEPGHEARALDLIAPYTSDDLSLAGWSLVGMSPGPSCEVHFAFERGTEQVRFVYGPRSSTSDENVINIEGSVDLPVTLRLAFIALVESNTPEEVFRDTCLSSVLDSEVDPDLELDAPLRHVTIAALVLSLLTLLGLLILRGGAKTSKIPTPPSRRGLVALGLLLVAAACLRVFVAAHMEPADYELENFTATYVPEAFLDVLGAFVNPPPPQTYHGPLLDTFLRGWAFIGDALGVGGELFWLRLPNLFLSLGMIGLLIRFGRALDDARTGWIAAGIFALSPLLAYLSVRQGHYFPEMVATTWFLERLAVSTYSKRPVHRSIAVTGAVALWTGYLSALVVGPGLLIHAVLTWRRGDHRRALGTIFLAVALSAPVLGCGLANLLDMSAVTIQGGVDAMEDTALVAVYGHISLEPASTDPVGALLKILALATAVGGVVGGPVLLCFLVLYVALAPREGGLVVLLTLVFGILSVLLPLRLLNLTPVMPLILVGSIRAAALGAGRFLPPRIGLAALGVLVAAIVSGSVFTSPRVVRDDTPFAECLVGWVHRGDIQDVMDEAMTPAHRELTLVRWTRSTSTAYELCPDRSRSAYAVACIEMTSEEERPGFLRYHLGPREVWEVPTDVDGERCPSVLGPAGSYRDLPGPFLLAIDDELAEGLSRGECPDPRSGRDCHTVAAVRQVELWLCEE